MIDWTKEVECDAWGKATKVEKRRDFDVWRVTFGDQCWNYNDDGSYCGSEANKAKQLRNVADFSVDKPGRYRMRNGEIVDAISNGSHSNGYCWVVYVDGHRTYRYASGRMWSHGEDELDLVEYIGQLESESAGLSGYV